MLRRRYFTSGTASTWGWNFNHCIWRVSIKLFSLMDLCESFSLYLEIVVNKMLNFNTFLYIPFFFKCLNEHKISTDYCAFDWYNMLSFVILIYIFWYLVTVHSLLIFLNPSFCEFPVYLFGLIFLVGCSVNANLYVFFSTVNSY